MLPCAFYVIFVGNRSYIFYTYKLKTKSWFCFKTECTSFGLKIPLKNLFYYLRPKSHIIDNFSIDNLFFPSSIYLSINDGIN